MSDLRSSLLFPPLLFRGSRAWRVLRRASHPTDQLVTAVTAAHDGASGYPSSVTSAIFYIDEITRLHLHISTISSVWGRWGICLVYNACMCIPELHKIAVVGMATVMGIFSRHSSLTLSDFYSA